MRKKKELSSEEIIEKKIWKKIWGFLGAIVLITGVGLWQIYVKTQDLTSKAISDRISKQFEDSNIKKTLTDVANAKGEEILNKQIRPEIEQFKAEIKKEFDSVKKLAEDLKTKYLADYNTFKSEVVKLEERNELTELADKVIVNRDVAALEDLERVTKDSARAELTPAATSELKRAKTFFATMTSIKGISIERKGPLGSIMKDKELTTNMLIFDLKNNTNWRIRVKAAELLRDRNEKGVPDILVEVMNSDLDLEVRKTTLDTFEAITGFVSNDVFGFKAAREWWIKNKSEVDKKLKEPK